LIAAGATGVVLVIPSARWDFLRRSSLTLRWYFGLEWDLAEDHERIRFAFFDFEVPAHVLYSMRGSNLDPQPFQKGAFILRA